jgi:chromosome segregation protein
MLKSLELFGFKSFADRTLFEFSAGITCVVGPNGSGKSNVVDSIKWVLGDQSPKSLRGKEMTDVIFNGSGGRKPAGYAEATLTFDNSKNLLNVDTHEVQIGRRIYRSGEAEYLINRVPVRLKDVKDLFLGTGAGTSAYSIIEQGRVDALLQATNVARRTVFEEAAGISKFNLRKQDALRKLERVAQNLVRLTDIVDEVRGQLTTLKSQATKAQKFREYTEELKVLRVGLAADDYRVLSVDLEKLRLEMTRISAGLSELTRDHQQIETQQSSVDSLVAECEDRLRAVERLAAENREAVATHEATIMHQSARKTELESEVQRLQQQQQELQARAAAATGELHQTDGDLHYILTTFEARQAELLSRENALRDLASAMHHSREVLDRQRERQLVLMQQVTVLQNRVGSFDSQFAALESARKRALIRREQLQKDLEQVQADLDRRQLGIETALGQMSLQREIQQGVRARREEILFKQEETQRNLATNRELRSANHARKSLIEDLERRQEGLGVGVKEILARAKDGAVPPWNTVLGSVSDLLSTEIDQAALLEVSLGTRAQVIVLSEYGPLIEYLHEGRCQISGRVGFLALSGTDANRLMVYDESARRPGAAAQRHAVRMTELRRLDPTPDFQQHPGVTCRADQLVKSSSGLPQLAEQLLSDTWIVESLDVAFELAAGEGRTSRFVTLQGELLESDGTLFVGTVRSETALVSRKSELRSIKNDLIRLDRQIQLDEARLQELAVALTQLEQEAQSTQLDMEQVASHLSELKSGVSGQEMQFERYRRERDEVQAEHDQLVAEQQTFETDAAEARREMKIAEDELAALKKVLEDHDGQLAADELRLREGQEQLTSEQLDFAKQEERINNLQSARQRLDQERFQRDLQREEAERRLQVILTKTEQIEQHLQNSQSIVGQLNETKSALLVQVAERQAEKDQVRQKRSAMSEQELRLRHQRRELQDQHHAFELKAREISQQIQHLSERLLDEYQLELVAVAASGASACIRPPAPAEGSDTADESNPEIQMSVPHDASTENGTSQQSEFVVEPGDLDPGAQFSPPLAPALDENFQIDPQVRAGIEEQIDRLRRKLKLMGNVNTDSLRDLDELESRYNRLHAQLQDLVEAKSALEEIVRRINTESRRMFLETFTEIRTHFQALFRKLFGGGEGDVVLEDPENVLECGIDVVARPPGKELRSISLLSGGEKTLTAVALLMAIFQSRPSPFCILDEVDAALDEGNVERYMKVVQEFRNTTQFIVITHSKRTMSTGDVLYGVTMEESGVSKRMSVRFDDISEDGNFKTDGSEAA